MSTDKSTVEQMYSVYEHLSRLQEDWDHLSQEERFGSVDEARTTVESALEGHLEWEIGIEDGDGNWEFYGSRKFDQDDAERDAIEQAEDDEALGSGLNVYQVNGPFMVKP